MLSMLRERIWTMVDQLSQATMFAIFENPMVVGGCATMKEWKRLVLRKLVNTHPYLCCIK